MTDRVTQVRCVHYYFSLRDVLLLGARGIKVKISRFFMKNRFSPIFSVFYPSVGSRKGTSFRIHDYTAMGWRIRFPALTLCWCFKGYNLVVLLFLQTNLCVFAESTVLLVYCWLRPVHRRVTLLWFLNRYGRLSMIDLCGDG